MKVFANITWLLLERGAIILVGLVANVILARSLGVKGFGEFQYAISVFNIFLAVTYICGAEVLVPALCASSDIQYKKKLLVNSFLLRLAASFFSFIMLCSLAWFYLAESQKSLIVILGLMLFFKEPFGVMIAWLQANTNNRPSSIAQVLVSGLKLVAIAILFFLGFSSVLLYGSIWVLEALALAIIFIIYYRIYLRGTEVQSFDWPEFRRLFRAGVPFWGGLVAMYLVQKVDRLLLNELASPAELGIYAAAVQVTENLNLIGAVVVASMAPHFIYSNISLGLVKRRIVGLFMFMIALGFAISFGLMIFANLIVFVLYGPSFAESASLLKLLAVVNILYFGDLALSAYVNKYALGQWQLVKWLIVLAIVVGAAYGLIPRYGVDGAVYSLVLGYLSALALGFLVLVSNSDGRWGDRGKY